MESGKPDMGVKEKNDSRVHHYHYGRPDGHSPNSAVKRKTDDDEFSHHNQGKQDPKDPNLLKKKRRTTPGE